MPTGIHEQRAKLRDVRVFRVLDVDGAPWVDAHVLGTSRPTLHTGTQLASLRGDHTVCTYHCEGHRCLHRTHRADIVVHPGNFPYTSVFIWVYTEVFTWVYTEVFTSVYTE